MVTLSIRSEDSPSVVSKVTLSNPPLSVDYLDNSIHVVTHRSYSYFVSDGVTAVERDGILYYEDSNTLLPSRDPNNFILRADWRLGGQAVFIAVFSILALVCGCSVMTAIVLLSFYSYDK